MTHGMGGANILSAWVDVLWIVALAAVLVLHCASLARTDVEHRWLHLAHAAMIVGMISMYVVMANGAYLVSAEVWTRLHLLLATAIVLWMLACGVRERPFSFLWWPALAQQVAMIYMWTAASDWVVWLTDAFAVYFVVEAVAWLLGSCTEARPRKVRADGPEARSTVMLRRDGAAIGKIGMAPMAASMGYMLVGMQLLM